MGGFRIEVELRKPIDHVFRYLADLENTPRWYSAVKAARRLEGRGLGSKYEIVRQLPQGRVEAIVEVLEFDPPRLFTFGTSQGTTPFSYQYVLEEKNGVTVIRLNGQIELSGAARFVSPLTTQAFKRGMQSNLETLKQLVEA